MLTKGSFRTCASSPQFDGFHDPQHGWDHWSVPSFERDQVDRIITWVMDSPDDGEHLAWSGDTLLHRLGDAEPGRIEQIDPDAAGRYRIGARSWPWLDVSVPAAGPSQPVLARPVPEPAVAPLRPPAHVAHNVPQDRELTAAVPGGERVHHLGLRTIVVRCSDRPGRHGFDVFCAGARLSQAAPFTREPDAAVLSSFLTTRKRGLDLLLAEHGVRPGQAHGPADLFALLHERDQDVPRYAAIVRRDRHVVIDLQDTFDSAVQCLRAHAATPGAQAVGIQDLDGPFLPLNAETTGAATACGPRALRAAPPSSFSPQVPVLAPGLILSQIRILIAALFTVAATGLVASAAIVLLTLLLRLSGTGRRLPVLPARLLTRAAAPRSLVAPTPDRPDPAAGTPNHHSPRIGAPVP
jgi:hypothetical protein